MNENDAESRYEGCSDQRTTSKDDTTAVRTDTEILPLQAAEGRPAVSYLPAEQLRRS